MDPAPEGTLRDRAPRSPGAILAAERERQNLARADVAQRLHMSVTQVEALEAGEYSRLPRGPFLRGFTRNYARLLGLDAGKLVGLLAEDAPQENAPRIVVPTQNIRFDPAGQRLTHPYVKAAGIAAALLVLGFAGLYWWLFIRTQGVAPATTVRKPALEAPKAPPPVPPERVPSPQGVTEQHRGTQPQSLAAGATAARAQDPPVAPPPVTPGSVPFDPPRVAAPGEGTIRLAFRGAAWVEITDARGRQLLSRTHAGGSNAEVVGRPPFSLVIGNAPEVRVNYNGRDVDLEPHTRVAVARFTLP